MERFATFHASHFADPAKRAWCASHLAPAAPAHGATREEKEDAWTALLPGETEAAWQARHGLKHLTPGAARMFDQSRRFREQRAHDDEAQAPHEPSDLDTLRTRALAAMHKKA